MRRAFWTALLSSGLLIGTAMPSVGVATHSRAYQRHIRHKRHVNTARRVGIGAAGSAAIGGLAEAGKALALVPLPARALVLNTTHIRNIRGTGAMTAQLVKGDQPFGVD